MPASIIRVTQVTCGEVKPSVAFYLEEAASTVYFETTTGLAPERVHEQISRLFEHAIDPDYDPVSGLGSFLTLGRVPDIASYEVPV